MALMEGEPKHRNFCMPDDHVIENLRDGSYRTEFRALRPKSTETMQIRTQRVENRPREELRDGLSELTPEPSVHLSQFHIPRLIAFPAVPIVAATRSDRILTPPPDVPISDDASHCGSCALNTVTGRESPDPRDCDAPTT